MSVEQKVTYELELSGASAAAANLNSIATGADSSSGKMGSLSDSFAMGAIKVNILSEALQVARNALSLYTDLVRDTITMGIESQTENRAFAGVFQEFSGVVTTELQNIANSAGYSNDALRELAVGVQDFLVPIGVARGEAAQMSVTMIRLATDISAFRGGTIEEVMAAMQSGLAGASKPMMKYGVDLRAASVEQELFNMGVLGGIEAATAAEKAQARLNIITNQSSDSHGMAVASLESVDGMVRQLESKWRDLQDSMGDAWMPLLQDLMPQAIELFDDLGPVLSDVLGMTAEMGGIFLPRIMAVMGPLVDYFVFWHDSNMLVFNGIADGLHWLEDLEGKIWDLVAADEEVISTGSDFSDSIQLRIIQLQLQNTEVTYTVEQLLGMKNALIELGFFEEDAADSVTELNARIALQKGDMSSLKDSINGNKLETANLSREQIVAAMTTSQLTLSVLEADLAMGGSVGGINAQIDRTRAWIAELKLALSEVGNVRTASSSGFSGSSSIDKDMKADPGEKDLLDPKEALRAEMEALDPTYEAKMEREYEYQEWLKELRITAKEEEIIADEAAAQAKYDNTMYFAEMGVGALRESWSSGFDDIGKDFKKLVDKMMKELVMSGILSAISNLAGGGSVGLFGKIFGGGGK